MLVMVLRRQNVSMCNTDLTSTSHATVNAGKRRGIAGGIIGVKYVVLVLLQLLAVFVGGHVESPLVVLSSRKQPRRFGPLSKAQGLRSPQAPSQEPLGNDELHTLGLLEELRDECKVLWGASSDVYFRVDGLLPELANPNLHDIPMRLPFRVEMWDRSDQHVRWVVAASSSVAIAHAALDAAIANNPTERFTPRSGILVIRQHPPN